MVQYQKYYDKSLGNFIRKIREEKGISQTAITKNLMAQTSLSSLELKGELPGKLLLDALVQRLGVSTDSLIIVLSKKEYDYFTWRRNTIVQAENGILKEQYWNSAIAQDRSIHRKLQEQFYRFWKGYSENNVDEMREAIALTVSPFPFDSLENICLGVYEVDYILMYIEKYFGFYTDIDKEIYDQNIHLLIMLIHYMERCYDETEIVKVHGKAVCLYARFEKQTYEREKYLLYEKAYDIQVRHMKINGLEEILQGLIQESNKLGITVDKYKKELWALQYIKKEFSIQESVHTGIEKFHEFYLFHEVLKSYRKEKQYSISTIEENACSEKTYRALENGKRNANGQTYEVLAKLFEIPFGIYDADIITDCYDDIQIVEKIKQYRRNQQRDKAQELLNELEKKLGEKSQIEQNKQFIERIRNVELFLQNRNTPDEFLCKMEGLLRLTIQEGREALHYYTRNESMILYYQAIAYRKKGEVEKAIKIIENLWNKLSYDDTKNIYRQEEMILLLRLWKNLLTDIKQYDLALQKTQEGIHMCFHTGRGDKLNEFVFEVGWIYERCHTKMSAVQIEKCRNYFLSALYISRLFKITDEEKIIKDYIGKNGY